MKTFPSRRDASVAARLAALFVDLGVLAALGASTLAALGATRDPAGAFDRLWSVIEGWTWLLVLLYFATLESWGGTAGKRLFALRVETGGGEPVGYARALWRNLAKGASLLLFPIAVVCALSTERKRSIHDLLAGTVVSAPGPPRARARALRGERRPAVVAAVVVLLPLVGLLLAQRYGRMVFDAWLARAAAAAADRSLEAFPEIDGAAFFREQHARCFERTYTLRWTWNRLDEAGYRACLGRAYAAQMTRALVLEEPEWAPWTDPRWARLEFTARLNRGRLPAEMEMTTTTICEGGVSSSGGGQAGRGDFDEVAPGAYRGHTLVGLDNRPCRLRLELLSGGHPLGPPLVVAVPTPDPARIAAQEDAFRLAREAEQRTWQCVLAAREALPPLPPAYTDDGTDALSDAVRRLRSSDVSVRHEGARALEKIGPPGRSAIGELVRSLGDTNENSKEYVIQALVAVDPAGRVVAPALRCLAGEPKAGARIRAGAALVALGDPSGLAMLRKEIQGPEERDRAAVVRELRTFASRRPGVASLVAERLRSDPAVSVRVECARALPWLDPHAEEVEAALHRARLDPSPEVREEAMQALRDLPGIRSRPAAPSVGP